jgi:uncharacterized protein YdeI (YjbR/CyaY-like superfamily)
MSAGETSQVEIESSADLRTWLQRNYTRTESVWLITYKKPDPRHVPWADVVDQLLCFGWIDSQPRKLDEARSMLRISPRNPKSTWSKINKDKIARLMAEGLMHDSGLAVVEAAKKSGTWVALDQVEALQMPEDLQKALAKSKTALENFEAFPKSAKRGILDWISQAKRPETRQARVTETVEKAKLNLRANQWQANTKS